MESQLDDLPPAQTSYIYAADNATLLTMFYEEYRQETSLVHISPYLIDAIVAAEDARFYQHNGVDIYGLARAFVANRKAGEVSQGASTITMQYVRMALRDGATTPEAGPRRHRADATRASCARCASPWRWRSAVQAGRSSSAT